VHTVAILKIWTLGFQEWYHARLTAVTLSNGFIFTGTYYLNMTGKHLKSSDFSTSADIESKKDKGLKFSQTCPPAHNASFFGNPITISVTRRTSHLNRTERVRSFIEPGASSRTSPTIVFFYNFTIASTRRAIILRIIENSDHLTSPFFKIILFLTLLYVLSYIPNIW